MDSFGRAKEIDYMVNIEIPGCEQEIWDGLNALNSIHEATNRLAIHDGQTLANVMKNHAGLKDILRSYVLALYVEVGEFLQELNWKPWKGDQEQKVINQERVIDEFADILAFLGVIITILGEYGITPNDLSKGYIKKERVNVARFMNTMDKEQNEHK